MRRLRGLVEATKKGEFPLGILQLLDDRLAQNSVHVMRAISWLRGREPIANLLVWDSQIRVICFCSLIPCFWFFTSLFSKMFSLLSFVGNWPRNRCSTAVFWSEIRVFGS
jgi:hypothetical protein